jgi:stearoyl-CoA desaturase (delta-9 desaturase)
MTNPHPYYQTLFVVWGNQILWWISTILFFHVALIPLTIISMYLFGCMSEISIHRYLAHKAYSTTPFREKILLVFAFLAGQGASLSWVSVHRSHHAYEDTPKDPHSPQHIPTWKLVLGLFPRQEYKVSIVSDLFRSKNKQYFVFENKYYWLMWTALWIASALINFYLFYVIVSGAALWYLMTALVNIMAHGTHEYGTKTDLDAVAMNSKFLNVVTGAGNHNNHHSNPKNYSYKITIERDPYAWVIDRFFKL